MNAVLYTTQLEPITVVDIPMFLWDMLAKGETVQLEVFEPVSFVDPASVPLEGKRRLVRVFGEKLRRGRHETLMLFTRDEENALALPADFLVGQRHELQRRQRAAFVSGVVQALRTFGG